MLDKFLLNHAKKILSELSLFEHCKHMKQASVAVQAKVLTLLDLSFTYREVEEETRKKKGACKRMKTRFKPPSGEMDQYFKGPKRKEESGR